MATLTALINANVRTFNPVTLRRCVPVVPLRLPTILRLPCSLLLAPRPRLSLRVLFPSRTLHSPSVAPVVEPHLLAFGLRLPSPVSDRPVVLTSNLPPLQDLTPTPLPIKQTRALLTK